MSCPDALAFHLFHLPTVNCQNNASSKCTFTKEDPSLKVSFCSSFKDYKFWNPQSLNSLFLSCLLIGCWATERANQRAVQKHYRIEWDFGVPEFALFKICYLYHKHQLWHLQGFRSKNKTNCPLFITFLHLNVF